MKIATIAIAAATLLTTVPAIAAVGDPLQVIYRVSGVLDSGDAGATGYATVFFCTNFSTVDESVRISLRPETSVGTIVTNTYDFTAGETRTFATHDIAGYSLDSSLGAATSIRQGSAIISATTVHVNCSAAHLDAATTDPVGIPLHMVRLHPANNSQEDSRGRRSTVKAADDPFQVIYRVTGVLDSGSASGLGSATLFFCTNFSGVAERVRLSLRRELSFDGPPINEVLDFDSGETRTWGTHGTATYSEDSHIAEGVEFLQGSAIISATSLHVHCSAAQVDASADVPSGSALHMVRLRPAPGTQE
jgi:hypothetical protein